MDVASTNLPQAVVVYVVFTGMGYTLSNAIPGVGTWEKQKDGSMELVRTGTSGRENSIKTEHICPPPEGLYNYKFRRNAMQMIPYP